MIPLKLQIKNFLSYGSEPQTIDFSPYHLICLSGKNGHGKSALLDAITWALWGQARKTLGVAKADQGLLRLGQTQMFVALDFMFNGQTYRVRREFAKTYGKPFAALDFGIVNQETQLLIPLTDKTIRQTQEKIESLLNLDIDSFVNSAFLRQGQSNEFSKKTAKERKVVLATILGLNRYETIRTLAMEKVKEAHAKKDTFNALRTSIEQELLQKDIITTQLATLDERIATLNHQEDLLNITKNKIEQQRVLLNNDHNACQQILFQKNRLSKKKRFDWATYGRSYMNGALPIKHSCAWALSKTLRPKNDTSLTKSILIKERLHRA